MAHLDDIVIRFVPFEVSRYPYWEDSDYRLNVDGKDIVGVDDPGWCSLPDILYADDSSEFLGLSFPVVLGCEEIASKLASKSGDARVAYIRLDSLEGARYEGFGECQRLEVYWKKQRTRVLCEIASLFHGCWLYDSHSPELPFGYWLSLIGELVADHHLTFDL